nr:N-acetylmannosamine-6-phosphate 2-epimerase [Spiroplasma sp. SV19]
MLNDSYIMQKIALACVMGGAEVLRLSQKNHIMAVQKVLNVPIIGLIKQHYKNSEVFITPTREEIDVLLNLNVDVIALDATLRIRPYDNLETLVSYIREKAPTKLILADCSNIEDIKNADRLGFDLVATTLRGYTNETTKLSNLENNYEFIKSLDDVLEKAVLIVEGGIWTPEEAYDLLHFNHVHAVVVGSAITRPQLITERFIKITKE